MKISMVKLQKGAVQRAKALSVPKRIYIPYLSLVRKWYKSSGDEWAVDRLKAIKLDIIRHKAGMPPVSSWIKRGNLYLKGAPGALEKWMLLSDRNFSKGIQLLQIYTLFMSSALTEKQKQKFMAGVTADPPPPIQLCLAKDIIDVGFDLLPNRVFYKKIRMPSPLVDMLPSPCKRAPLPSSSVPEGDGIIDSLRFLFESSKGFSHYIKYKDHYRAAMGGLWSVLRDPEEGATNRKIFDTFRNDKSFLVGRIGLIQEPGFKLRAVANPGRIFQNVLEPFGKSIYDYLKNLPFDCTFDQTKAIPVLQEAISHGKTIHSIDLSGATDYFPLALQEHLLRKMFPDIEVSLFCDISRSTWFMPQVGNISWLRGQPLGLYPSFGAFALTHGTLLLGLLGKEWNKQFFILGDDVVILDDQLAADYNQVLSYLGCPVSIPKSLSSNSLCEFGGKLLTANTVVSQYKWREISDESFMDLAKILGPKSLPLFRPRQVKMIKRLSLIPEFLGGLGWNPKGISLSERCSDPFIWYEKLPVDLLMDYSLVRMRNLMNSHLFKQTIFTKSYGYNATLIDVDRDLDQRSSLIVKNLLPSSLWNLDKKIIGKNIDGISMSLYGIHADLPFNTLDGTSLRPTLLSVLEAKDRHSNSKAMLF